MAMPLASAAANPTAYFAPANPSLRLGRDLAFWRGAGLGRGSGLPLASITIQPDRQGQGSFRLARGLDGWKVLARSWSLARGALVNRLAPPDREGLRR